MLSKNNESTSTVLIRVRVNIFSFKVKLNTIFTSYLYYKLDSQACLKTSNLLKFIKMKNVLYIVVLMFTTVIFAQNKPKNVSEETTTKTIKVDDGSQVLEQKVKITTREEQQIELDAKDKNKVNQDIVSSPSKVTQTIEVATEKDPMYDSKTETIYYNYNDESYIFKKNNKGFLVSELASDSEMNFGNVLRTSRANNYYFVSDDYTGIGHFDSNNNFVIEYYDASKEAIVRKVFNLNK